MTSDAAAGLDMSSLLAKPWKHVSEWLDFFEFLDGFSIDYKEVDDAVEVLREKTSKFRDLLTGGATDGENTE